MAYEGVIFDVGGVVLPSPFEAWAAYERELALPVGFIRTVVAESGEQGAWARHERGELGFEAFLDAFGAECAAAGGPEVSAREVIARLTSRPEPRPEMLRAIGAVRAAGLRTAALTNNWVVPPGPERPFGAGRQGQDGRADLLAPLFDVVVESSVEGLRKPDPRIYLLTCARLGVAPERTVFLDDLGVNLKPARELGMTTIKVVEPRAALAELEAVLGLALA